MNWNSVLPSTFKSNFCTSMNSSQYYSKIKFSVWKGYFSKKDTIFWNQGKTLNYLENFNNNSQVSLTFDTSYQNFIYLNINSFLICLILEFVVVINEIIDILHVFCMGQIFAYKVRLLVLFQKVMFFVETSEKASAEMKWLEIFLKQKKNLRLIYGKNDSFKYF